MSELKPACPNCRSLSTTFLGDVGKKNWSCDDCLCTWDQSRSAAQLTPQAGEAEPVAWMWPSTCGVASIAELQVANINPAEQGMVPLYRTAPPSPVAPQTSDLAALVACLAWRLKRAAPDSKLPQRATDYLVQHGLAGSILRELPPDSPGAGDL